MSFDFLYVLDCSGYLFRSYYALPRMSCSTGESTHALFGFIRSVHKIWKDFSPKHLVAVFDGQNNKRERQEIYAAYKAHRSPIPEDLPHQIEWAKQFCQLMGISNLSIEGVEADDTMGSIAKWAEKQGACVYLCTGDKDICQLVASNIFVLHTHKDNLLLDAAKVQELYGVPPEAIPDLLALIGDSSDNIPGVTGIGPKTAAQLLQQFHTLENLLQNIDQVAGKKKQQTLEAEKEVARYCKQLALLNLSVSIPLDQEFYAVKPPDGPALKEFYQRMNFSSFLKELRDEETVEEEGNYILVDTVDEIKDLVEKLGQETEIAFDTETTGVNPHEAQLVGIGFCCQAGQSYYVPFNGQLGAKNAHLYLKPLFESAGPAFFGHNVKFDLHALQRAGMDVSFVSFDTMLASYLLNAHNHRHSLEFLASSVLSKSKGSIADLLKSAGKGATMADVSIDKVCNYCALDADLTLRLKKELSQQMTDRGLDPLFYDCELPLLRILEKMERRGVFVDASLLQSLSQEFSTRLQQLQEQIYSMAGTSFNISSPKQLADILFGTLGIKGGRKTTTGQFSTNAEILQSMISAHPIIDAILQFRTLEKLRSTYVDKLVLQIHPDTGRIHPTFNQVVASTGRLSCQDPNLQNIPVRSLEGKKIRQAFRPQNPAWRYLSADYSQIELRLLAHMSQDPDLLKAFQRGDDIHAFTASQVFNVPLEQVTSEQRARAKAVNFGILYGQQAFGLSQGSGMSMKEAAHFIESYFQRYPSIQAFLQQCKEKCRQTGKAVSLYGRERLIPEIHSKNPTLRAAAERLAVNTPLQGTAADIIKMAMIRVDRALKDKEGFLVLQIHDELLIELPQQELQEVSCLVKEAMEQAVVLDVPLTVDISVGKNWKEC